MRVRGGRAKIERKGGETMGNKKREREERNSQRGGERNRKRATD